jgi:hypothetical protein
MIWRVRTQCLLAYVAPYRRVRLERIAEELFVTAAEAESLCMHAILSGTLKGKIDQEIGILVMDSSAASGETDRLSAILSWCDAYEALTGTLQNIAVRSIL